MILCLVYINSYKQYPTTFLLQQFSVIIFFYILFERQ